MTFKLNAIRRASLSKATVGGYDNADGQSVPTNGMYPKVQPNHTSTFAAVINHRMSTARYRLARLQ